MALSIDTAELRRFAAAARACDASIYSRLRTGLTAAGELVANEARERAEWSTRIPRTIKVSSVKATVATVSAGGPDAPHAAPLENGGRTGDFRHPVNAWAKQDRAEWKWAPQQARPFLGPAADARADEAAELIVGSVEQGFLAVLP